MHVIALRMDGDPPSGLQGIGQYCCSNGKIKIIIFLLDNLRFIKPSICELPKAKAFIQLEPLRVPDRLSVVFLLEI